MSGKTDIVKGRLKEAAGALTDDDKLRAEGKIDQAVGMAIGYVMALVRDSIKDSLPQLASQIEDLVNSVTTKLGAEPQHSA